MVCLNEVCMKGEKRKGEREFSIIYGSINVCVVYCTILQVLGAFVENVHA